MKNYCCLSNVLVFFAETSLPCTPYSSDQKNSSVEKLTKTDFTFFLHLLQPKAQHCVPNFPIFLTAYNNYVAKVVTPIWRRFNFAGFIFCPSRHELLHPVLHIYPSLFRVRISIRHLLIK